MKYQIKPAVTIMFVMALSFASCNGDSGADDSVISIAEISGITVPVTGATPVTAITETDQYTGTVEWSGTPVTFASATVYTATITLTAKSGYTLNGVDENFFTVAGATTVSNPADSGVITASFPETGTPLSIGDSFGGGVVAYILQSGDPGYVEGEQHGLIATTADKHAGICWISGGVTQTTSLSEWTGTAIGTGSANTDKIIADAEAAGNYTPGSYAAGLARATEDGGYTDWYLPSKDELNKLYLNKAAIGGFVYDFYWSSSQSDWTNSGPVYKYAWAQSFDTMDGYQYEVGSKNATYSVRPVRSF